MNFKTAVKITELQIKVKNVQILEALCWEKKKQVLEDYIQQDAIFIKLKTEQS